MAPAWQALTAAMLHTLWIGALLAGIMWFVLRRLPVGRPGLRYTLALAALLAMPVGGCVTWIALLTDHSPEEIAHIEAGPEMVDVPVMTGTAQAESMMPAAADGARPAAPVAPVRTGFILRETRDWTPWLAAGWLAGVTLMLGRCGRAVARAGRIRAAAWAVEDTYLRDELARLKRILGVARRIGLEATDRLVGPVVAGLMRPVILLPAAMLNLPPDVLHAVLAHELAHVRRHDNLINLVQMVIEALLFFNPFAWWISNQVRIECEACCDLEAAALTGRPEDYARAVLVVAERFTSGTRSAEAVAAMDGGVPGGLLDRVRRLLGQERQSAPKLGGPGSLAAMAAALGVVSLLLGGTLLATSTALKVFSNKERAERIAEINDAYGQPPNGIYGEVSNIPVHITGAVKTWDNRPLPAEAVVFESMNLRQSRFSRRHSEFAAEGNFSFGTGWGKEAFFVASAPGYAPLLAGPFSLEDVDMAMGDKYNSGTLTLDLTLPEGHTSTVQVVGAKGEPVAGAQVRRWIVLPEGYGKFEEPSADPIVTDTEGRAVLPNLPPAPVHLAIEAPGYGFMRLADVNLNAEEMMTEKLEPSRPAPGVVLDRMSGIPIAGAKIEMVLEEGPEGYLYRVPESGASGSGGAGILRQTQIFHNAHVETDAAGRFELTTLRPEASYSFAVTAPEHEPAVVHEVTAGQEGIEVRLGPELFVKGRVLGLPQGEETLALELQLKDIWPGQIRRRVNLKPAEEGGMKFEARDLWPGELRLGAHRLVDPLEVREPVEDWVIDLREEPERPDWAGVPMRTVRLKFVSPSDAPPVEGSVLVSASLVRKGRGYDYQKGQMDLENGVLELDVPAGGYIDLARAGDGGEIQGYWFDMQHIDVPAGNGVFEHAIETQPAGGFYGRLLGPDGAPASHTSLMVWHARDGRLGQRKDLHWPAETKHESGRYLAGPLPLGWRYQLRAVMGNLLVISDYMPLKEHEPLQELDIQFPEGVPVQGRVWMTESEPAPHVELEIEHELNAHGLGMQTVRTDENGWFSFMNVNPDVPGDYKVKIRADRNQPGKSVPARLDGKPMTISLDRL